MDLMELRRGLMMQMAGGKIPVFMNHLESGSFLLESTDVTSYGEYDIQLKDISKPKGFLLYSNEFNMFDAKASKPMTGAFASLYIEPADISDAQIINTWTSVSPLMYYGINWGQGTDQMYPTFRRSQNEGNRGMYLYNQTEKKIRLRGFNSQQSEYDFRFGIT